MIRLAPQKSKNQPCMDGCIAKLKKCIYALCYWNYLVYYCKPIVPQHLVEEDKEKIATE